MSGRVAVHQAEEGKPGRFLGALLDFATARALRVAGKDPRRAHDLMAAARAVLAEVPTEEAMVAAADRFLAETR